MRIRYYQDKDPLGTGKWFAPLECRLESGEYVWLRSFGAFSSEHSLRAAALNASPDIELENWNEHDHTRPERDKEVTR